MQDIAQTLTNIAIWAIPVVFAITVHEVSHGYVAHQLGDNTAYQEGRLTLNPLKHIDLIGTVIVPLLLFITTSFVFGWAKPVPVVQRNLKNPIRDMAIVAAAGPLSNFVMALFWALVLKFGVYMEASKMQGAFIVARMGEAGIIINLILGVLNLIPIPPLDGSRVVSSLLSPKAYRAYNRLEPYGFFILLFLLVSGVFQAIIAPPVNFLLNMLQTLIGVR